MRGDFRRIIREEFEALKAFLPEEEARKTVNDNFNFIEDSDFGNISLQNLQYLVKQCFFSEWIPHLDQLYRIFVKGGGNATAQNGDHEEEIKGEEENVAEDDHNNSSKTHQQSLHSEQSQRDSSKTPTTLNMFDKIKNTIRGNNNKSSFFS